MQRSISAVNSKPFLAHAALAPLDDDQPAAAALTMLVSYNRRRQKLSMSLAYDVVILSPSTLLPAISLSRHASPPALHILRLGSAILTLQCPSEKLASLARATSHLSSAFCRSSSRQNPCSLAGMASCTSHHRACASSQANCRSAATFQLQS
uniref:Uncharacterized protein n=1 Tax=Arundo donax TaxID=35708 RepID=A0A0A8ZZ56_ARUDO